MTRVEDWIGPFLARHINRFRRHDWPSARREDGKLFFDGWTQSFKDRGILPESAERASVALMRDAPRFLDGHLPALVRLALADQSRATAPATPREPEDDGPGRKAALDALKARLASDLRSRDSDRSRRPGARGGAPRALPAHSYLDGAGADPVVERERSARTPREPASAPNLPSDVFVPDDACSI